MSERVESTSRWGVWEFFVPRKLVTAVFRPSLDDLLYDVYRAGPARQPPQWRVHLRVFQLVVDCLRLWFIGLFVQGGRPTWKAMALMSAIVILFALIVFANGYATYPAAEEIARN